MSEQRSISQRLVDWVEEFRSLCNDAPFYSLEVLEECQQIAAAKRQLRVDNEPERATYD